MLFSMPEYHELGYTGKRLLFLLSHESLINFLSYIFAAEIYLALLEMSYHG